MSGGNFDIQIVDEGGNVSDPNTVYSVVSAKTFYKELSHVFNAIEKLSSYVEDIESRLKVFEKAIEININRKDNSDFSENEKYVAFSHGIVVHR